MKVLSKLNPFIKNFSSKIITYLTNLTKFIVNFLKKYWFYLSISTLIILFFINSMISIILGIIFGLVLIAYYLMTSSFKYTLINFMNKYQIIEDHQLSEELSVPLEDVRKYLKIIAKKQKKNQWLVVSIKHRCVFYNANLIEKFIDLYNDGLNEKNIFNTLIQTFPIKSRAEIKAIENSLIEQGKIDKRDFDTIKLLSFESEFSKK